MYPTSAAQALEHRVAQRLFHAIAESRLQAAPRTKRTSAYLSRPRERARIREMWELQRGKINNEYLIMARVVIEMAFNYEFVRDMKATRKGGNFTPKSFYADVHMPTLLHGNANLYRSMLLEPRKYQKAITKALQRKWEKESAKRKYQYIEGARKLQESYTQDIRSGKHSFSVPQGLRMNGWSMDNPFYELLVLKADAHELVGDGEEA